MKTWDIHQHSKKKTANLILFNTCCVREHAEDKLYGNVGALKHHKENVPGAVIAVCGCMMQQPETAKRLYARFPFVDIIFGTNSIHRLDVLLNRVLAEKQRAMFFEMDETIVEDLPAVRNSASSAFVNIIYGCNNYCTYCIVPYVRGRERSRKSSDILREINALSRQGVSEITLLGQNVNSYGNDLTADVNFPQLLRRIDQDTDIRRVRFMTSHPKDMSDELIACYGSLNSLCEHIHLPVQSGSSRILKLMNRRYTSEHYLSLIASLRQRVPEIAITTDIIVGFPGETESDFAGTMDLVKTVGFDAAYTFAFSPRPNTKAADMPGQLDRHIIAERLKALNTAIKASMAEKNRRYLGRRVEVLVDSLSKRTDREVTGRTRAAKTVSFTGSAANIGRFVTVEISQIKAHTLHGIRREKE